MPPARTGGTTSSTSACRRSRTAPKKAPSPPSSSPPPPPIAIALSPSMPRPTVIANAHASGSGSRSSQSQSSSAQQPLQESQGSVTNDDESQTDIEEDHLQMPRRPAASRPPHHPPTRRTIATTTTSSSSSIRHSPYPRAPVVVLSSDEEDAPGPSRTSRPSRTTSRPMRTARVPTVAPAEAMDTDTQAPEARPRATSTANTSGGGFLVDRVVRSSRPQPIVVADDDILHGAGASDNDPATTATNIAAVSASRTSTSAPLRPSSSPPHKLGPNGLPLPRQSPTRGRPPIVAHPLLSKYTCPICLCAPHPHAVTTPCGHVFCSECLFEALQTPAKQKQDEIRQQAAAFAQFSSGAFGGYGWPSAFFGGMAGMGGGLGQVNGLPGSEGVEAAALAAALGGLEEEQGADGVEASSSSTTATTSGPSAGAARLDPLVGPCPVCRAPIPGGFIRSGAATTNSTTASGSKRPVFGLQFKLGKPIDDPRRSEA